MRKRRLGAAVLLLSTVVSLGPSPATATAAPPDGGAAASYLVVLRGGFDPGRAASDHARAEGARVAHVYRHALRGYAATMSPEAAARISRDPRVALVEADQVVHALEGQSIPTGVDRIADPDVAGVPLHLTIDGSDDVRVDVDVAVVDTGIDHTHPDLHVVGGTDCTGGSQLQASCTDGLPGDGNGHGTHVAGTVAAIDDAAGVVGVAPGARLWAVKVLDDSGSGTMSGIVAGVDWVTANAGSIEVANMSLGCECTSAALDTAIASSVAKGVVYAVAAGNSDKDASTFSPANHPDVITVSALADFDGLSGGKGAPTCRADEDETLADFSNFGGLLEIAAPGVCITSTWPGGGYQTISGTSMASPHVAGAAALLTSKSKPADKSGVEAVRDVLVTEGNAGWSDPSGDGVQEPLLDVSDATVFMPETVPGAGGEEPPAGTTLSASFTSGCSKATCSFDGSGSSGATSWSWEFGDGTSGSGERTSRTFTKAGTHTVTLIVGDGTTSSAPAERAISCKVKGKHLSCG